MGNDTSISVRIPQEWKEKLAYLGRLEERDVSAEVRKVIHDHLRRSWRKLSVSNPEQGGGK